jgi:hypothetical protein
MRGLAQIVLLASWVAPGLLVVSGCVAAESAIPSRAVIVSGLPPAPIMEEPTPPPQAHAVWIAGYWHGTGVQYAWIPGHWEGAPPVGSTWRAPRYVSADGAYFYEPGRWGPGPAAVQVVPPPANAFH